VPFPFQFLRATFWALWLLYVVAALVLLGMRYVVLPRIDDWRPRIEQYASDALGASVHIGKIQADWSGLHPRLALRDVRIDEPDGAAVLSLPAVEAVVAWRSVLRGEPRLRSLRAEGLDLTLRRDADNRLWVAGRSLNLSTSGAGDPFNAPALRWLARQGEVALRGATVRWIDERRGAPELVLNDASVVIRNGLLSHRFAIKAAPPAGLAGQLQVRGEVDRFLLGHDGQGRGWQGQLYAEFGDAAPAAWGPWLDLPVVDGRMAARAWLTFDARRLGKLTADVAGRGLGLRNARGIGVRAAKVQGRVEGLPGDVLDANDAVLPWARSAGRTGLAVRATASDITADLPGILRQPQVRFAGLEVDASARRDAAGTPGLTLRQTRLHNDDLDLAVQGAWSAAGATAAGTADLRGMLARASMNAIHRYLPLAVTAPAREWLQESLRSGVVHDAALTLRGDLEDFPFSERDGDGHFRLAGKFADATVDYVPATPDSKGWPMLAALDGGFAIDGAALALEGSPGGLLKPADPRMAPLVVRRISAHIPDMEHDAELTLTAEAHGPVPSYLSIANTSPLGALLDDTLARARGQGDWSLALALKVPLQDTDATSVDGTLVFEDSTFNIEPAYAPPLERMRGMLAFTENDVRAQNVEAQLLGGPVRVQGSLRDRRDAMRFEGELTAAALQQWLKLKGLARLKGRTAYRARLYYPRSAPLAVTWQSDLAGMALDLPAPLGKDAAAKLPLSVQWGLASDAAASADTNAGPAAKVPAAAGTGARQGKHLAVTASTAATDVVLLLEQNAGEAGATFARGALAAGQRAVLPARGLAVKLKLPELDAQAWQRVADEFQGAAVAHSPGKPVAAAAPELLPPIDAIDIDTPLLRVAGAKFNDVSLQAHHPAPAQWEVKIAARQALGSLSWREASGAIAGKVVGRFMYLNVGSEREEGESAIVEESAIADDEFSDIPAIDIQANTFRLYGKDLGTLSLTGTNLERGRRWRLDQLQVRNPAATLDATGVWLLSGPQRGLSVDASAKFMDFGGLLDRLGKPQTVAGGSGNAAGKLTWRGLPWSHDLANIDATLEVNLDNGRFIHINSRSARLLELLSMQSLQRLARLEFNPANLLREGFPFDSIRGHMTASKGLVTTDDYKVSGPVATVVLAGVSDMINETWDLKAVVIPNLDASGAAALTALAVNPLLGLGAFVTQWILKYPLARAMTVQYAVTGSWDDPKVEPVEGPLPGPDAAAKAKEHIEP